MSKVLRNTTAYMIAGFMPNFVSFFMLPVYTRFLTPADYGIVSLVVTLTTFIAAFMGLQLGNSLNRMYFDYKEDGARKYFSTTLFAILAISLAILLPIHCFGEQVTKLLFPKVDITYSPYMVLRIITVFFMTFVNYFNVLLRVQEKGGTVLFVAGFNTLLALVFGVLFVVVWKMGAEGVLLAQAFTAFFNMLMLLFIVRKHLMFAFDLGMVKKGLAYSLPMIPHAVGGILFLYTDKYILAFFVPLSSIGLYDIASRLAMVLRTLVASFNNAIRPTFMRSAIENRDKTLVDFRSIITKWSVLMMFVYLGLAMFSNEFITLLLPKHYHGAYIFVPILLVAYLFRGLQGFTVNAILYAKETKAMPLITFSTGIFNVVANLLLIPLFGVMAAAITTVLAYAMSFILSLKYSNRYYRIEFAWRELFRIYGFGFGLLLIVILFRNTPPVLHVAIECVALTTYVVVMNKCNYGNVATEIRKLILKASQRVSNSTSSQPEN